MKITRIPYVQKDSYYTDTELDGSDLKSIPQHITDVWYSYWTGTGCYEGGGEMIARTNEGEFLLEDLGHCSCYGPLEYATWKPDPKLSTIEGLRGSSSEEALRVRGPLLDAARKDYP